MTNKIILLSHGITFTLKYCMYHPKMASSDKFMHIQVVTKRTEHGPPGVRAKKIVKKIFVTIVRLTARDL